MTARENSPRHRALRRTKVSGLVTLCAGIVVFWAAESLSWHPLGGSVRTLDESQLRRIEFVGERLSWLGVGLLLVNAFGQVTQPDETSSDAAAQTRSNT